MATQGRKPVGRPRQEPKPGERVQLSFRVTPELKRMLDEAANASGRSQSQEAEFRLERSFDRSDLLAEVLELTYGRQLAGLLKVLGQTMDTAAVLGGRNPMRRDDWLQDYKSWRAAQSAAMQILGLWNPAPKSDEEREAAAGSTAAKRAIESLIEFMQRWIELERKTPALARHNQLGPILAAMVAAFHTQEKDWQDRLEKVDPYLREQAAENGTEIKRRCPRCELPISAEKFNAILSEVQGLVGQQIAAGLPLDGVYQKLWYRGPNMGCPLCSQLYQPRVEENIVDLIKVSARMLGKNVRVEFEPSRKATATAQRKAQKP